MFKSAEALKLWRRKQELLGSPKNRFFHFMQKVFQQQLFTPSSLWLLSWAGTVNKNPAAERWEPSLTSERSVSWQVLISTFTLWAATGSEPSQKSSRHRKPTDRTKQGRAQYLHLITQCHFLLLRVYCTHALSRLRRADLLMPCESSSLTLDQPNVGEQ